MSRTEEIYTLVIGIVVVFAAFLMFDGRILEDSTTGLARVLIIIGICLITSGPANVRFLQNRSQTE